MNLSHEAADLLCCPTCKHKVVPDNNQLHCTNNDCAAVFPIVEGVPVLINDESSVFTVGDFTEKRDTFFYLVKKSKLGGFIKQLLPSIGMNVRSRENYRLMAKLLLERSKHPRVLVIGGSIVGEGLDELLIHPNIELVETDVAYGPRTMMICDAHDIPFADESFDAVIAQAVLEHVTDPYRCVDEMFRVMKEDGIIYSETPFMQQVHAGRYDFTRFTHLGHRRLFRRFDEVDSGTVVGPGSALAWSYQYFLYSFATSKRSRRILEAYARLTSFWWKYFDPYLAKKPGAADASAGYFFIGRKSKNILSDKDLIKLYKGAF